MDDHVVLKSMNLSWLQHLDVAGAIAIAVCLVISLIGSYIDSILLIFMLPFGFTINIFLRWFQSFYFYEYVKCAECRSKINYFKNGKKIPSEQAWGALRQGKGCRVCGWKPIV